DELDSRPIDVSARRAARIASLLGDTEFAVYLGFELKPTGGHPPANAEDARRLMTDPTSWGDPSGPAERAFNRYLAARMINTEPDKGKILAFDLAEIHFLIDSAPSDPLTGGSEHYFSIMHMRKILERVRHTVFTALCAWERQLTYANVNER